MIPVLYDVEEYTTILMSIYRNYDTYYGYGAIGSPANDRNRARYNVPKAPDGSFIFDCSGYVYKAIPLGWNGDKNRVYGGADPAKCMALYNCNDILKVCSGVSSDFSNIVPGEVLYMKGHVGYYIGDGLALECTTYKNVNRVIISNVTNVCKINGHPYPRKWLKHGKMPFLKYPETAADEKVYTTAKLGEGLIKIARRSGITFEEIKRLNPNIKAPLYIVLLGQKVRIK